MIDAYEIGIRLALENGVSAGVAEIHRDLAALDAAIGHSAAGLISLRQLGAGLSPPDHRPSSLAAAAQLKTKPKAASTPVDGLPRERELEVVPSRPAPATAAFPSLAPSRQVAGSEEVPAPPAPSSTITPTSEQPRQEKVVTTLNPASASYDPPASRSATAAAPDRPRPTAAPDKAEEDASPVVRDLAAGNAPSIRSSAVIETQPPIARSVTPPVVSAVVRPSPKSNPQSSSETTATPSRSPTKDVSRSAESLAPRAVVLQQPDPQLRPTERREGRLASEVERPQQRSHAPATPTHRQPVTRERQETKTETRLPARPSRSDGTGNPPMRGNIILDGRVLGRWLADRLAHAADRPPSGSTNFDPRLGPSWPGAPNGG